MLQFKRDLDQAYLEILTAADSLQLDLQWTQIVNSNLYVTQRCLKSSLDNLASLLAIKFDWLTFEYDNSVGVHTATNQGEFIFVVSTEDDPLLVDRIYPDPATPELVAALMGLLLTSSASDVNVELELLVKCDKSKFVILPLR